MRVLALDHGSARCGAAVSDPTGTIATPLPVLEKVDSRKGFRRVVALVEEVGAERVVVGLPVRLAGGDSEQTEAARAFADRLRKALDVPVELFDERFTTAIAAARGGAGDEDSRAAAVLLEDWLRRAGG